MAIDKNSGDYETFRRWEVVADDVVMESPDRQVRLMDAVDESEDAEVGDYIEEQIENPDFGRIAAQAAKQVMNQRIRETEREMKYEEYAGREGGIFKGAADVEETVQKEDWGTRSAEVPQGQGQPIGVEAAKSRGRGEVHGRNHGCAQETEDQ